MSVLSESIVRVIDPDLPDKKTVVRLCGTDNILVETGEEKIDVLYRVRLHFVEKLIRSMNVRGLIDITPGVRSLLITYDGLELPLQRLLDIVEISVRAAREREDEPVPSRRVTLPIAFHDSQTLECIQRYIRTVRESAPYLPDNMEFVARCNGLSGVEEVKKYFLASEHMVMGLGDVYLGAPCALPLDPRYRLSAPKYNPARTVTPEGAVGIGGAFTCIYPMRSPGGYQLIGRTVPFWNTFQTNDAFREAPWLLRFFDRIAFEPVEEEELDELSRGVKSNEYRFKIEPGQFDPKEYRQKLESVRDEAEAFSARRKKALPEATRGY